MSKGVGGGLSGEEQLQGPISPETRAGKYGLMLNRLKFDKILMKAQELGSCTCVELEEGRTWGCTLLGSSASELQLDVTTNKANRWSRLLPKWHLVSLRHGSRLGQRGGEPCLEEGPGY